MFVVGSKTFTIVGAESIFRNPAFVKGPEGGKLKARLEAVNQAFFVGLIAIAAAITLLN